jgi:hypothetical protein
MGLAIPARIVELDKHNAAVGAINNRFSTKTRLLPRFARGRLWSGLQHVRDGLLELWHVSLRNLPGTLYVNAEVIVHEHVSKCGYTMPLDLRMVCLCIISFFIAV